MEKENTAKSGTGMEEMMKGCCGDKGFSPEMMEKMKGCCGGMKDPEMMKKMRDCCGEKGFKPEMMQKWMSCCGTGDKKE